MASSNLGSASTRDGSHASQTISPYFQNTQFSALDPALSFFDDQASASSLAQFSHYPPNALIGQDLAASADHQQHLQPSHSSAFENEWSHNVIASNQDEYGANFFESPYGQRQFENSPRYSPPRQDQTYESGASYTALQHNAIDSIQAANNVFQDEEQQRTIRPLEMHNYAENPASNSESMQADQQPQIPSRANAVDSNMHSPLPPGTASGSFVITSVEEIEKIFRSQRLHNFVHVGLDFQNSSITKTALPAYAPRKSRSEIMSLLKTDSTLKAKLNKRLHRSSGSSSKSTKSQVISSKSFKPSSLNKKIVSQIVSDDESDEDEYSSDDTEEDSIQAPLPAVRPSGASEGISYDTVKALWRVPYRSASRTDIQTGLSDFWKTINTIRNRWKSDAAAVQEAEAAGSVNDLPLLKERVTNQRQLLEVALTTALKHGHKDLIEHLGQHRPLMSVMAAALQDRAKESDYNGEMSKLILEILHRSAATIEKETLDKLSMIKLVQRFSKRGEGNGKNLAEQILKKLSEGKDASPPRSADGSQVKELGKSLSRSTKKETSNPNKAEASETSGKIGSGARSPTSLLAGVKRIRDNDPKNTSLSKKPALGASSEQPKQNIIRAEPKQPTGPMTVKKVTPKQPNIYTNLQPTYKKSVTPAAGGTSGTAKEPITRSVTSNINKSTTQPGFSFAATMADLKRPKEAEPIQKKVENTLAETPEEKATRLRKEKRRSLRVSFKPESELEEVRYFQHDPEEEMGHFASQVRDVRDIESEGRMFRMKQQAKQQQKHDPDKMDLDEEDDEDDEDEDDVIQKAFTPPAEIDFSEMPDDAKAANYAPFGGGQLEPDSPAAAEQRRREEDTLVAVYARKSEIPPSPREPAESSAESQEPKTFGKSEEEWFMSRLKTIQGPTQPEQSNVSANLSAILNSFAQRANEQAQPTSQPLGTVDLDKILAQLRQPGSDQHAQPQPLFQVQQYPSMQPQHQQQPMQTYQTQQQHIQPTFSTYPQQNISAPVSFSQSSTPQMTGGLDISALLASHQRQFGAQAPTGQPSNTLEAQAPPHESTTYENEDRRRLREGQIAVPGNTETQQQARPWQNQNKKPRDPNRPTPKFVLPCRFWQEGKCTKGANCTYRHDLD